MIVGKQNILQWFEDRGVLFWDLFTRGGTKGSPIARSSKDRDLTKGESYEQLRRVLDLQDRGQFTLSAQDTENITAKGGFKVDFEIPASEVTTAAPATATPFVSGMPQSIEDLDRMTENRALKLIESKMLEMKVEKLQEDNRALEKENKELEKEVSKGSNRFWDAINGIGVDKILSAFMQPKSAPVPQVSGIPDVVEPPETDQEYANRLGAVISIFQNADPDWLETLEKMAAKVQHDPSVLNMFKKFL